MSEQIFNNPILKERRRELRKNATHAEVLLWLELKGRKINGQKFRRQHSIDKYVVDFYCPKLLLAVEVDGATHMTDEEIQHDKERQSTLEDLGISFLRFTNEEIYDGRQTVIDTIWKKTEELEKVRK